MKQKISIFFLGTIISIACIILFDSKPLPYSHQIIMGASILALVSILFMVYVFVRFLMDIQEKITSSRKIRFGLNAFSSVRRDVENISKKLDQAVSYIETISNNDHSKEAIDTSDKIGKALFTLRGELSALRQAEEEQKWIGGGMTSLSELLRNKTELHDFSKKILDFMVKYLNLSQGVFYVAYDEKEGRYLKFMAGHAFTRNKGSEEIIYEGQGILGQNMTSQEFVFLSNIPTTYTKISSGLGQAMPRNIIIAPLTFNERYQGAIEFSAFKELKDFEIVFLKMACKNIAGEIASLKAFEDTQKLLSESNALAEQLNMRDERMKKNIQELDETQARMKKKQVELNSYLKAIDNTIAAAEFDLNGKLVFGNDIFQRVMGYTCEEVVGKACDELMVMDDSIKMMWNSLLEGRFFSGEFKMKNKEGKEVWLSGTFNPIDTGSGKVDKIMMYAQFTTKEKEKLNELGVLVTALKSTLPMIEFNENFQCKSANEKFLKLFGFTRLSLRSKSIKDIIAPYYVPAFEKVKHEILLNSFSTVLLPVQLEDKVSTFEGSISIAQDGEGNVSRVILLLVKEIEEKVTILSAM